MPFVQTPLTQTWGSQRVPPLRNPDPSVLHIAITLPLHPGWFGVHSCVLHASAVLSQYCVAVQVCVRLEASPLVVHWRSSCPWQNLMPAGQTTAEHAPATQTWLLA